MQERLKQMEDEKTALESSASKAGADGNGKLGGIDGEGHDAEMGGEGEDEPAAVDARSIYIGNVSCPLNLM